MTPSIVSLIITIAFFVFLGLGFLFGYLKGAMKSMVDLVAVFTCALVSVIFTKIIVNVALTPAIMDFVLAKISTVMPAEMTETIQLARDLLTNEATRDSVSDVVRLVASLPAMLITPIIYIVLFCIFAVALFVVSIIIKVVACEKSKKKSFKLLGGALGAIAFGAVFTFVLTPVWGYVDLANSTMDQIIVVETTVEGEETEEASLLGDVSAIMDTSKEYLSAVDKNFIASLTYNLGGKAVFNSLTTINVDKTKINLQSELSSALELTNQAEKFLDVAVTDYGPEQVKAINEINKILENSEFLPLLISKTISFASSEYSQGHAILGVEKPNLGERFNPTLDRILNVTKETSSNDVRADIRMISNIFIVGIEEGTFENGLDVWTIFESSEFLSEILVELYGNTRTNNSIPYLMDALTNYIYERYNVINGFDKKPEVFDYQNYNDEQLKAEAQVIANMTKELHTFASSAEFEDGMEYKTVINDADFAALGRSLGYMRSGIFTGRIFDVMFYAFLHSEAADDTGLVDKALLEKAADPTSDLEILFSSRQNVLKLAVAIQENRSNEERKELMHVVVEDILLKDESAISFITQDNLVSMGMTEKEAVSIDAIVNSMISGAHGCEFADDDEKANEVEKTEAIIDAVSNTIFGEENDKMFNSDENSISATDMSAQDFVDSILDSKLSSAMINSAVADVEGELKEDPYKIQDALSENDKVEIQEALNATNSAELTEEEKQTLNSLAIIFGVTID